MPANVNVQVSILVKSGGYTGQRDAWEEFEKPYAVALSGRTVSLEPVGTYSGSKITFSIDDLNEAIAFLRRQSPSDGLASAAR